MRFIKLPHLSGNVSDSRNIAVAISDLIGPLEDSLHNQMEAVPGKNWRALIELLVH